MNIGIETDKNDFLYDIHSLVHAFFPDDDVNIYTADEEKKARVPRDMLIRVEIPSYKKDGRKAAKDALKQELYDTLSDLTGKKLPWGMLSGIRPTKIPLKMLRAGTPGEKVLDHLTGYDRVSEKRAALALSVAEREMDILKKNHLGNAGWSLYVNIPFCPSICLYCTFSSSPADVWKDRIDGYLDALLGEMQKRRDMILAEKGRGPDTIYIGGGTPTALTAVQLSRLLGSIREIWNLDHFREFTVEAGRPDSFSTEKLSVMKAAGVSRISVNPQTMNQKTLDFIGRRHTAEDAVRAFSLAREAGFDNINMDIILGLPGEGEAELLHTLSEIRKLSPDSLTVHSLAVKRASRLTAKIREDREHDAAADRGDFAGLSLENDEHLMDLAAKTAADLGMEPYYLYRQKNMRGNLENTGFARPGRECLYNILIMEEIQSIYAFGAGASTKYVYPDGRIERKISPKNVQIYIDRENFAETK